MKKTGYLLHQLFSFGDGFHGSLSSQKIVNSYRLKRQEREDLGGKCAEIIYFRELGHFWKGKTDEGRLRGRLGGL